MRRKMWKMAAVLMALMLPARANALFYDLTPLIQMAPQFCAMCVPSAVTEVISTYQQAYQMKDKLKSVTNIGTLTKMMTGYGIHLGKSALHNFVGKAAQGRLFSTSRTIKPNSLANMTDEASVKQAIKSLFLQYPSKKSEQIRGYSAKLTDFQVDSLVEMYVSAEDLSKKMDKLMEDLDKIELCVLGGNADSSQACSDLGMEEFQCNASEGQPREDSICFARNSLLAAQIYDKIMIYNEYLTAMLAQHRVTVSLGTRPTPLTYGETQSENDQEGKPADQQSFLNEFDLPLKAKSVLGGKAMAFASAEFDEIDNPQGYVKAFEGKENEFDSLEYLERAQSFATEAIKAHNMKQQLPSYKKLLNTYKNVKKMYEKYAEKLAQTEVCAINYLGHYYTDPCYAWFGERCSKNKIGGNFVFHYSPEKSLTDKTESKGVMDVICSDDHEHLCYVQEPYDFKNDKKGLKAYLLALYDNTKIEDATQEQSAYLSVDSTQSDLQAFLGTDENSETKEKEFGSDTFMTALDAGESTMGKSENFEKRVQSKYDAYKAQGSPSELLKPSTEKQVYAEERKDSLLNWTLGSLVSKQVINDIVTGKGDFGSAVAGYPLWNDQKEFYDQYIIGKYENIKDYFAKAPKVGLLANMSKALVSVIPVEKASLSALNKAIEDMATFDESNVSSAVDQLLVQEKSALQKLKDGYHQKIAGYAAEKASIYKQMDDYNARLNEYRKQYNTNNAIIQNAEHNTPAMQDAIEVGNDLYKDREEDEKTTEISPQNAELTQSIEDLNKRSEEAKVKRAEAERNIVSMQNNIEALQKKVDALDEKIEAERAEYVKNASDLISEHKQKIDEALENWDGSYDKIDVISKAMEQFPIVRLAGSMIKGMQNYVIAQVDAAEKEILQTLHQSGKYYYPQYHDKILKIHNEMVEKITAIQLSDVEEDLSSLLPDSVASLKNEIFAAVLGAFQDLCAQDYCTTPDDDYFVGITAKKRDMKAPKAPVEFASAPLREVFHFDDQDYDNIDKWLDPSKIKKKEHLPADNDGVIVTGDSFLEGMSGDVPEIWKYILRHRAYIEKDFDFTSLFDEVDLKKSSVISQSEQELIRSGVYPCSVGSRSVDATVAYDNKYPFGYATTEGNHINECMNVHENGRVIWDNETDAGQNYRAVQTVNDKRSELGQILAYVVDHRFDKIVPIKGLNGENLEKVIESKRHKLTFNRALQRGIYVEQKLEENNSENAAADAQYHFIQRMLLKQNQMSSYLDFLEMEKSARESLEKIEIQVRELMADLKAFYEDLGYTWSNDFDLLNEEDFEKAEETLEQIKETKMAASSNQLAQVKGISDKVQNDIQRVMNMLTVLQLDGNEMLIVSGDEIQEPGDDVEFLEKIKTADADGAVGDEYAKRSDEEYEKRIKHLPSPYCPSYQLEFAK